MIYGDQWDCKCGWSNLFVRNQCRNCGGLKGENVVLPFEELLSDIEHATQGKDEPR